jgi:hypothetical protein
MAKAKKRKKPVKGKSERVNPMKKRGVKVRSKEVSKPIAEKKRSKSRKKKEVPEVKPKRGRPKKKLEKVILPEIKEEPPKPVSKRRKKIIEKEPPTYETSGGMRKRYYVVLEEETYTAFSHRAYMRQEYAPVLMNQIIKEATKAEVKLSRKDMEQWMDEKAFDDGIDEKREDAPIVRPYNPNTRSYNRMRRRFTCTLEEKVVDKFRNSVKNNLYGSYLINHLMREHLRGNLEFKWTPKYQADSLNWSFGDIPHGGDLIPYELGEPAAIITHEWTLILEEQKAAKDLEKASKPKRKKTFACIYPRCDGRASKHVSAEDKTDIYYKCNKCKKTFHRTAKKEIMPEESDENEVEA